MLPKYSLDKIKFTTDEATFKRAVNLYESGKVTEFQETFDGFSAVVIGTNPYEVLISARHFDQGTCDCYLGQNNTLCKHMVAVAIRAITAGKPLNKEDKKQIIQPKCSDKLGTMSEAEMTALKRAITTAMRYIKPYNGPSRLWFTYQNSLQEGCARLSALVSKLPVDEQTARILVDMLLRLDQKLTYKGVDDSDGIVGGFIEETVQVLKKYVKLDPTCAKAFHKLKDKETCFGWEKSLLDLVKK